MIRSMLYSFVLCLLNFTLETQESHLSMEFQSSLEHLNIRNGLQLESILLISDSGENVCRNSFHMDFYFDIISLNTQYLLCAMDHNLTQHKLQEVLGRSQLTYVVVLDFDCSSTIQNAIFGLSKTLFVSNVFIFIQLKTNYTNDYIEKLWSSQFERNWKKEFTSLPSQVYILKQEDSIAWSLSELYKPCKIRPMLQRKLITFSNHRIQSLNTKSIWERRKDLSGCHLKVAYINTIHFHEIVNQSETQSWKDHGNYVSKDKVPTIVVQGGGKSFSGLDREVFNALYSTLNFSIVWVHSKDNKFGAYNRSSNQWNGLVNVLARNEADMTVCWLTVTQLRGQVVSYAESLYYGSYKLYTKKPEPTTSWTTYVDVFSLNYWITLIIVFFVMSLILFFGFYVADRYKTNQNPIGAKTISHTILSAFSATLLSVGAQDVYLAYNVSFTSFKSTRFILLVTCFFGMINYYVYNGALISTLMVHNYALPIKELSDFSRNSEYKLLVPGNGAERMYLEYSFDPLHQNLWKKTLKEQGNLFELNEAKLIIEKDSNKVLFGPSPEFEMLYESFPCQIISTGITYGYRQLAFPFKKNSPLLKLVNHHIARIMESGLETHMHKIKVRSSIKCKSEESEKFRDFSYHDVISAFICSGIGCIFAIFYCIIEKIRHKYSKHRKI